MPAPRIVFMDTSGGDDNTVKVIHMVENSDDEKVHNGGADDSFEDIAGRGEAYNNDADYMISDQARISPEPQVPVKKSRPKSANKHGRQPRSQREEASSREEQSDRYSSSTGSRASGSRASGRQDAMGSAQQAMTPPTTSAELTEGEEQHKAKREKRDKSQVLGRHERKGTWPRGKGRGGEGRGGVKRAE